MTATVPIFSNALNQQQASILLVEDNRVSRLVAERLIKRWGYGLACAVNGQEAVSMASAKAYNLILMNLGLPDMSGREAALMIRRLIPDYNHTPIIAFSANLQALREKNGPFTDSLQVPYMPEQLKNLLQQYLSGAVGEDTPHKLQARLDVISGKDPVFRQQLTALYAKSCQELLHDLQLGRLDNAVYLEQVRHKHRSSLRLLELYSLEAALDNLQDILSAVSADPNVLSLRKQAVAQQVIAIMDGLTLEAA
ncbi:response regulator [Cesiribacter sp. SM1]|uniref:response regulator n=1 Tax=Cesiribacter sp. SM1 TaxID=2861196 RepID=UPI001CD64CF0|nr:response regulator [Cesiribacter sp. SM1]